MIVSMQRNVPDNWIYSLTTSFLRSKIVILPFETPSPMTGTALPSDTEGPFILSLFAEHQLLPRCWDRPGALWWVNRSHSTLAERTVYSGQRGYTRQTFLLIHQDSHYGFSQLLVGFLLETICNYLCYLLVCSWLALPDPILKLKPQVSRDLVCVIHWCTLGS